MTFISFSLEVHQPYRLKYYPDGYSMPTDEKLEDHFLNNELNKFVFDKVAKKSYYPTFNILLETVDLMKGQKKEFKFSINFSGVWLEQCERWHPDLLETIKQLIETKRVEVLGSTYFHSLASVFDDKTEFKEQVRMHSQKIKELFGVKPKVMMNTEMIYDNLIAKAAEDLGFKAIFAEGVDRVLGWRSPNYVYVRGLASDKDKPLDERIRVLLRHYRLSDDIGFRFSAKWWDQWPLTAEKYSAWLAATPGQVINIFIDFETFGEHHWEETGIFWFLKALPWKVVEWENLEFATPSEIIDKLKPVGEFDVPGWATISWADIERDLSAWLGNNMQQIAFNEIKQLGKLVKKTKNERLVRFWRLLQQSDHLYYMSTKWWSDGDVHKYFSPFSTPHDAFVSVITALSNLKVNAIANQQLAKPKVEKKEELPKKGKEVLKADIAKELEKALKQALPLKPVTLPSSELATIGLLMNVMDYEYPNVTLDVEKISELSDSLKNKVFETN